MKKSGGAKYYVEVQRQSGTWLRDTSHFHVDESEAWGIATKAVDSGKYRDARMVNASTGCVYRNVRP